VAPARRVKVMRTTFHGPADPAVEFKGAYTRPAELRRPSGEAPGVREMSAGDRGQSTLPKLGGGLLPAGEESNVRQTNLYRTNKATEEVGGHA
jgi:hypothetical protein